MTFYAETYGNLVNGTAPAVTSSKPHPSIEWASAPFDFGVTMSQDFNLPDGRVVRFVGYNIGYKQVRVTLFLDQTDMMFATKENFDEAKTQLWYEFCNREGIDPVTGEVFPADIPFAVVGVKLYRAEGQTALARVHTLAEANNILNQWAATAPDCGAYDKCDFTIYFNRKDSVYMGRFDLQRQHMTGFRMLQSQMVGALEFHLNFYPVTDQEKAELEGFLADIKTL